jgi:hypothetical protein
MKLFALTTISLGGDSIIAAESEFDLEDAAEAERLIALGAAIDPDQRIIADDGAAKAVAEFAAMKAKHDELAATLAEATSANEAFEVRNAELVASLAAAHAEIDKLTTALAAAEKKAK